MSGIVAAALIALNLLTVLLFALDKSRAGRRHPRRIPERRLLWLAALGGTPGAYAGRRLFRHKTRKQPFVLRLHLIAAGQAALITAVLAFGGFG